MNYIEVFCLYFMLRFKGLFFFLILKVLIKCFNDEYVNSLFLNNECVYMNLV